MSNRARFRRSRGYSDRRVACAEPEPPPSPILPRKGSEGVLLAVGVGLVLGLVLGMVFLAR